MEDFPWYVKARGKIHLTTYVYKKLSTEDGNQPVSLVCLCYRFSSNVALYYSSEFKRC